MILALVIYLLAGAFVAGIFAALDDKDRFSGDGLLFLLLLWPLVVAFTLTIFVVECVKAIAKVKT
jgi:hypothetical protein